jgi:hypothetical protein
MIFPMDLGEFSILIAVIAIILLVTSELTSPYNRRIRIYLSRKRLRRTAIFFSVLFLIIVGIRISQIVISAL